MFQGVANLLAAADGPFPISHPECARTLADFVDANEDPSASEHLIETVQDEFLTVISIVAAWEPHRGEASLLLALKASIRGLVT